MTPVGVSTRYAWRSLRRNLRRTLLSVIGVAFGVGIGLIAISWIRGEKTMTINAAAAGGIGHLRVVPSGWSERHTLEARLPASWPTLLATLRSNPEVAVATPRARTAALLAMGTRSAHVELAGVDPSTEPEALRYVREIPEGRYLEPGEQGVVVIGRAIAERLNAILDDELVVTAVDAQGEMQASLLRIVGIAETGSREVDSLIAQVALADVEALSGRKGAAEITLVLNNVHAIESLQRRLATQMPKGGEILTWADLSPSLRQNLEADGAFYNIAIAIVLFVVLLGVASAQLTGVLERRKEFAVLAAVGMRGRYLVRIVILEGIAIGIGAALLALAWTSPILHRWYSEGVDLSEMISSEEGFAFGGVLLEPIMYPDFGLWNLVAAFSLSLVATLLASLYPAIFASRTDPAEALRVDR